MSANANRSLPFAVPPVPGIPSFYPQSLWCDQESGLSDTDRVENKTTYRLLASQRLEVGKYVLDLNNDDYSNPKYKPTSSSASASRTNSVSRDPARRQSRAKSEDSSSVASSDDGRAGRDGDREGGEAGPRGSIVRATYPVVEPLYPCSSASLFFPIYYGRPSAKDKADPRGLPQHINETLHPNDRSGLALSSVSARRDNLNRMCLYKIGPGAVAFRVVMKAFEAAGCEYTPSNETFNVLWAKRATPYTLAALTPYQKVNHFPGTWGIGRKDSLAQNITKMKRLFGDDVFDIVPASFLLPSQKSELLRDAEQQPDTPESPLIYIMKPSASSCGRGIYLCRGVPPMPRGTKRMVCQRYIGNPLLIFGRKFDLRLYCCVTSFDPLRIYLFDEGLVRFAAEKYPGADKDLENIHMHLTNYSVNKTAELNRESRDRDYEGEDPVDIKWCVSDLKAYLAKHHPLKERAWDHIAAECNDVVVKAFLSIEHDVIERLRIECRDRSGRGCFELFGLDLMADDALKVRLIEVNIMPSLATGTTLDKAVKSRMLAHLLTMVRCIPCKRNEVRAAMQEGDSASGVFCPSGPDAPHAEKTYRFGKHPFASARIEQRPLLKRFNDADNKDSVLTPLETLMLIEAEEELRCAGGFRLAFPHPSTAEKYLPLFTHGVSRNNFLSVSACLMREGGAQQKS